MKHTVTARVLGHKLFCPNPKDAPSIEVAKVSLVIGSLSSQTTKATTATVHVDIEDTNGDFALGRLLTLQFEDHQQELDLDDEAPLEVDGEKFDPETGEKLEEPSPLANSTVSFTVAGETTTMSGEKFEKSAKQIARLARGGRGRLKNRNQH